MRVITEFVKNDLGEEQLLPVVRDLLPALLNILGDTQVCPGLIGLGMGTKSGCKASHDQMEDCVDRGAVHAVRAVMCSAFSPQSLADTQTHTYTTRAECINVFRQTMKMLDTVREEHPAAVKKALEELSPAWLGAMQQLLGVDAAGEVSASWEALGLRIEIFRVCLFLPSRSANTDASP
jgi:hypothetical protein